MNSETPSGQNMLSLTMRTSLSVLLAVALLLPSPIRAVRADEPTEETKQADDAMATAVALNYCRAAFHRIRKEPTEEVLLEEEEKILNNLNLTQLQDPEVITLYTSVLDEIRQIGMADTERKLFRKNHTAEIRRQITWDAVAFGTDLITAQFGSAIRTGANSWWDYRNKSFKRDLDLHKIEKERVSSVVKRSSLFLDTFWQLARKKNIPDRWLVRGDDLDQLEAAMSEKDPQVRLRVLKRMEPFMQAYPPFWYYLARTHQELGQLSEAAEIYNQVEQLGNGHFRKDELLATAMANQAAIYDYLGKDSAIASAQKALNYSTDVWEANLMAARVLQRHGQIAAAEDAILRNLDVDLEQQQSHVFLASLYYFAREEQKLTALLRNPNAVAHLPAPVLLRCASLVGTDDVSPLVVNNILGSLEAYPQAGFGSDQLLLRVGYAWQLHLASLQVMHNGKPLPDPQVVAGKGYYDLRFALPSDGGFPLAGSSTRSVTLAFRYPDATEVQLTLETDGPGTFERPGRLAGRAGTMRIANIRVGEETFALRTRPATPDRPVHVETAKPNLDDAAVPRFPPSTNAAPAEKSTGGFSSLFAP